MPDKHCPFCEGTGQAYGGRCVCVREMEIDGFKVSRLQPFPPNENPYHYDLFNMGMGVGKNIEVMFCSTSSEQVKYIIMVNKTTGERIKITMKEGE